MTTIEIAGGRALDIQISGPADGTPLLFHHGTPGAVMQSRAMSRAAHARGLRLVTFSRPGYGASARNRGRAVVDVVADVAAILDHLGADRCLIAGWSGGGPHALATGARLPDRVAGVLAIAAAGPFQTGGLDFLAGMGEQNIDEFNAAIEGEQPLRKFLDTEAPALRETTPSQIVESLRTLLPPVDVAVITDEFGEDLAMQFHEALRTGVDGWVDDDLAFVKHWGFEVDEISVPTFVWQGSQDLMVPFAHGQWLAEHIPGVTAHLEQGEGHLSIGVGAMDRMLDELITAL